MPFILTTLASIPFGLAFLGFSIFWMWSANSAGAPRQFILFGLPFVLIGLGFTIGGPILGLLRYRNTEYMITDQRIIIQTGAFGVDTRFIDLDKIQEVYVNISFVDKMFGTGSLLAFTAGSMSVGTTQPFSRPSLMALKEPYKVQNLLQDVIEKNKES